MGFSKMSQTVHIVGAGLAGLSAAVSLAGRGISVVVHEAAGQGGGVVDHIMMRFWRAALITEIT